MTSAETTYRPVRSSTGSLPKLPSLTGMRFWAAFAVFLMHATMFFSLVPFQGSQAYRIVSKLFPEQLGSLGVAFLDLRRNDELRLEHSVVEPVL